MKTIKDIVKSEKWGRNLLPFEDLETRIERLYIIGSRNPPLTVKDFIQEIRRDESRDEITKRRKKMSKEYQIFKNLCPVYYDKNVVGIIRKVHPFEHYYENKAARYLWTRAFVNLVPDEETENLEKEYRAFSTQSLLEGLRNKTTRERNEIIKNYYSEVKACRVNIDSKPKKNLQVRLSFRGLLAYLFSEYEFRKRIENKKGKRDAEENDKEMAAERRKARLDRSIERIHQVIRNPQVINEAPFLNDSQFHESLGFDVVGLLLQISQELIDQLHIDANDDFYLLRRATERYFVEFNNYFFETLRGGVKRSHPNNISFIHPNYIKLSVEQVEKDKPKIARRLNEYRKTISELRRTWALSGIKELSETINKSLVMERSLKKELNDSNGKGNKGSNQ